MRVTTVQIYAATEAHDHVRAELFQSLQDTLAEAARDAEVIVSVTVMNGVPMAYNTRSEP
ncbi:hypothetical protein ACUWEX_11130 [Okibacterium fritillariae]|uniref:hypothetical protein n=1 Tax=Okibacterium fritillariae TaxID=123320 RepID=UPI0040555886